MNTTSSITLPDLVLPPKHPKHTKAIVLMYGWLGSIPKHVKKYAELYTARDCAVVYDIANVVMLMTRNEKALDNIAVQTVKKACEMIQQIEGDETRDKSGSKVPVIVHYFSNGGGFVVERLGYLIRVAKGGSTTETKPKYIDDSTLRDLIFLSDRLKDIGYEVADSAPAYLHPFSAYRAVNTTNLNFVLKKLCNFVIFLLQLLQEGNRLVKTQTVDAVYWNNMIENDLCSHQMFIYSTADKLTDSVKIDELMEERKKCGVAIIGVKFEDSEHVLHYRKYPKDYNTALNQIVDGVIKREE
eukprot:CAMPEP_0113313750 /NCGR_PEP_ID=MMETSP0010_2-20120614/10053_1 /TAXON_ID=216773 ORGANISM="Corethron hystrix, Strain 308" /NCGR_SAMPLE_ID=MMETSP0010_2 /ASSEMBLY_ACC=CAM_ASM_000155 /LENGTH=298 /DNA_ID=CAMNT_0000169833 /DNA_START=217 /DNA_END=1110 /DNA_ORIENTATION=+ /assembly_acc=CAM_ASM_000155